MTSHESEVRSLIEVVNQCRAAGWSDDLLLHIVRREREARTLLAQVLKGHDVDPDLLSWVDLVVRFLGRLGPPPGGPATHGAHRLDDKLVGRIRALLAKAESTQFEAEAEALTAKAQELVTKYAIDSARLGPSTSGSGSVVSRHVALQEPYLRAKFSLLSTVARANRCRAILAEDVGIAVVVGSGADVHAVDLLFTSLLTQATSMMLSADGGRRVRSFRQSFLLSFAARIGQRLERETAAAVVVASERSSDLLPELIARDEAVETAFAEAFPSVVPIRTSGSSFEGSREGYQAANRANLGRSAMAGGRTPLPPAA